MLWFKINSRIFTTNDFLYGPCQHCNEWELNNCIDYIESSVRKAFVISGFNWKYWIKLVNGTNEIVNIIETIILKRTWTKAASIAAFVVPMLSPNNTGITACKLITPWPNNSCKIPLVVLELCTIIVNTVPIIISKIELDSC